MAAMRTVRGLEQVEVARYGYAVEYDFFPAYQMGATLESKHAARTVLRGAGEWHLRL